MTLAKIILPQPNPAFAWVRSQGRWGLTCGALEPLAQHIFTTRSWRLGSGPEADGWPEVAESVGTSTDRLLRVRQVHGTATLVHRVGRPAAADVAADIIAGDDASMAMVIRTADCVPLLLADRRTGVVAAVHAGWRGTALRAVAAAITALKTEYGSRVADLIAAIGPSIGPCCYQVGDDVRERFGREGFVDAELERWFSTTAQSLVANPPMAGLPGTVRPAGLFLNLWTATRDQLEGLGVPRDQIFVAELCTASHQIFCSYRRDGKDAGRLAAVIRTRNNARDAATLWVATASEATDSSNGMPSGCSKGTQ